MVSNNSAGDRSMKRMNENVLLTRLHFSPEKEQLGDRCMARGKGREGDDALMMENREQTHIWHLVGTDHDEHLQGETHKIC